MSVVKLAGRFAKTLIIVDGVLRRPTNESESSFVSSHIKRNLQVID
jgi:hypothetical protein